MKTPEKSASPAISFVVPCYNYGRFLGDCIGSMLAQKGDFDFEIVVVDDGSTDESVAVARSFGDPRVRIFVHEKNQGHVATINEGIGYARGRFISRIDADDRLRPDFLLKTMAVFHRHPDVGMIYGNHALINAKGEIDFPGAPAGADRKGSIYLDLLVKNFVCAPTTIARREAWDVAMPIPAGLSHSDWLLSLRIARQFPCYHLNQVIADYRVHAANHHVKVIRDRTEEPSTLAILNILFSAKEADPALEAEKQDRRAGIMAGHYAHFALGYFGEKMFADARRCLVKSIFFSPKYVLCSPVHLRLLVGSCMPGTSYERLKSLFLKARSRA